MIDIKLQAEEYHVAEALSEIAEMIEADDFLDDLYSGEKDYITAIGEHYEAKIRKIAADIDGKEIRVGAKVKWYDPDEEARDLDRIYTVWKIEGDIVYFSDEFSEAEAEPDELLVVGGPML